MTGKAKHFTVEARDKIASMMAALPEKPKPEKGLVAKEVVASLKAHIKAARDKGYTIEEIIELFKQGGVDIGLTTLKTALKPPKKKTASTTPTPKNTKETVATEPRRVLQSEEKEALRAETESTLTAAAKKRGER